MKTTVAAILAWMALAGAARAQSLSRGYVEGIAQSTFGGVTSQGYGAEFGVNISPNIQVFGEFMRVNDTSTSTLTSSAQLIANALAQTQPNVGYHAEQPATFGAGGVRFLFATNSSLEPYVLIGGGVAKVDKNVSYTINGSDVTSNLSQYGVVLGSDLSGSETKAMLDLGAGVAWPIWQNLVLVFQYRYGRVFLSDEGLNINRAGVGVGFRF
jgi:opacity protein-like surface antigen